MALPSGNTAVSYKLVQVEGVGSVGVITIESPPVNALSFKVRAGLQEAGKLAAKNAAVKAVVIRGSGSTFCAGADISEFGGQLREPQLVPVINGIEAMNKPVVAAIHGNALGGGMELALGCHHRVALPSARVGLPEVMLGIIPGAGGTQRLPRLVGIQKSLELITSGVALPAPKAKALGILNEVAAAEPPKGSDASEAVLQFALEYIRTHNPLPVVRVSEKSVVNELGDAVFDMAIEQSKKQARGFLGPLHCIEAIRAAANLPFDQGMLRESQIIGEALQSEQARAQQMMFFAERQAAKNGVPPGGKAGPVRSVGIVGAGTMGAGIAINFLNTGLPTVVLESEKKFLDAGIARIKDVYDSAVKRKKMSAEQAQRALSLLKPTLEYNDLSQVDMVIEAVFEDMKLKKEIFAKLDNVCKPEALLCSNTSTLSVDEIASATRRPDRVIGTHFFSPANIMKLLEIVRGAHTSPDSIATLVKVGQAIRKVCVVVGNCDGFVGNRMLAGYGEQSHFLLEEGCSPAQVDKVLYDFGMAMGPFTMYDLSGNDVGWRIRQGKAHLRDPKLRYSKLGDRLCELGRFGQKTSKGWYLYEKGSRTPVPDPAVDTLITQVSQEAGITRRSFSDEEIFWRCMLPLINEGFKILEEGIATCPNDIDVVWVYGYGWPVYRGGPMFFADEVGLRKVLELMKSFQAQHPDVTHFVPSPLLEKIVNNHWTLKDYWQNYRSSRL